MLIKRAAKRSPRINFLASANNGNFGLASKITRLSQC